MRRACLETERAALEATPGVVDLLARLAREALPHLTAPVAANAGLSAAERDALMVLERYAELLQEAGCCESSQAAALLPEAMEAPAPLVLAGFDDLDCAALLRFTGFCHKNAPIIKRKRTLRPTFSKIIIEH